MSKILMVLKTQSLKNDQRVLKEMKSLSKNGANVHVFAAKDCDCNESDIGYPLNIVNIFGGAAPKNLLKRLVGVVEFYLKCIFFLLFNKNKFDKYWICDPIMFGLVLLIKIFNPKGRVVWDHHELPPDWFVKRKILMKFFKLAYKKADVVIHCNNSRKNYLENRMNFKHPLSYMINNLPEDSNIEEEELSLEAEIWIKENKFVYLQNCLQDDRNGKEVINALVSKGYSVFHAGKINNEYLKNNNIDLSKIFLGGYLSYKQINRVLSKSLFTVVLYKMDSMNQIYCDPNRLYQTINLGVPVIIGSNPSMQEICKEYSNKIILQDDGSDKILLGKAINDIKIHLNTRSPLPMAWNKFDDIFKAVVANV